MASIFEQTIVPKLNFSNFPLNEWQLVTMNFGRIVPVYVREVLPNDVFSMTAFQHIEFAPMVAPMYQEVNASLHIFYTPSRLVYEDFESFITGSEDGHVLAEDDIPAQMGIPKKEFQHLVGSGVTSAQGTILDYIGLPNTIVAATEDDEIISDELLRDYFKIWYDYYRDENLQVDFTGADSQKITYFDFWRSWKRKACPCTTPRDRLTFAIGMRSMLPFLRAYRKDYFTAALPTPQKGEPVTLSLGGDAPVTLDKVRFEKENNTLAGLLFGFDGSAQSIFELYSRTAATPDTHQGVIGDDDAKQIQYIQGNLRNATTLTDREIVGKADLSHASAITVEALREAFAVQEILESLSMRGSRFTEFLKGNFGVTPDDYRLQRPQFLGGIVSPVQIQAVIQQSGYSGEDSRDMTGYAAGRAFAAARDRIFRMRFKEHGYIMALASIMPKDYYWQGIPRHFLRHDRFDYYLPQTAHLGEQAIENQELYYSPLTPQTNKQVFGFIPRWAEYKTSYNGIHGDFRGNLKYYHMAREFGYPPTLSEGFIQCNPPTRPFAVWQSENPGVNHLIWAQYYFKVVASRPMPYHSIPKVL